MAEPPRDDPRLPDDGDGTLTNVSPVELRQSDVVRDPLFQAGDVVAGRYRVERFLARGGMGEVYRVHDRELGESVALKTILPKNEDQTTALDRFRREIQVARQVSHRNVCRIFDLGRHVRPDGDDVVFLTMELLDGISLRARLRQGTLAPDEALDVVEQLADGLAAAHRKGIVHRDLKPSNVFLVPEGDATRVVITDFGLARPQISDAAHLTVTGTGEILGTPAYMSPEQLEGRPATTASDVYALGLVMYEMLTGAQAFEGESAFQIALNKLRDAPTRPSVRSPEIPPRWEKTILRCLEKAPEDRFPEVAAIPQVLAGDRQLPRRSWRRLAGSRGLRLAAALVAVLAALAAAFAIGGWRPWNGRAPVGEPVVVRRAVAVLGFENVKNDPNLEWISTWLAEALTTELAEGGAVRTVPRESVSQARVELGIERTTTLGAQTAGRLRNLLASDLIVLGSYAVFGDGAEATIRLDSRIQDIGADQIIIVPPVTGPANDLVMLARDSAAEIRLLLGLDVVAESVTSDAFPTDPEAARLYAEGVARLQSFDPGGARSRLERAAELAPDSAVVWIELAASWYRLGFSAKAVAASTRAVELAVDLDREIALQIRGRREMMAGSWSEAVETFESLWTVYPDNPEYGIDLAEAQVLANRVNDALTTIDELRRLPPPLDSDPRIDLAEASAAESAGDAARQEAAARRAIEAGRRLGSASLEARARLALGSALRSAGAIDRAVVEIDTARRLMSDMGNRDGVATAHYALALAHASRGEVEEAIAEVGASLETARQIGARVTEADGLNLLGSIRIHQGALPEAGSAFRSAYELQRDIGNRSGAADALNNLALVQMWSGDLSAAIDSFRQALTEFRSLGMAGREAAVVANLARVEAARGDLEGARRYFEEAAGLHRIQDNREGLAEALFGLAEVLLTQGDIGAARTRHEEARDLRRELKHSALAESEFALAGIGLAEADLGRRDLADVAAELQRTVEVMARQERRALEADALNYLAEAQLKAGNLAGAERSMTRLRELEGASNPMTQLALRVNEARALRLRGDLDAATGSLDEVVETARAQPNLAMEFEAELARADLLRASGRSSDARRVLEAVAQKAEARGWLLVANRAAAARDRLDGG